MLTAAACSALVAAAKSKSGFISVVAAGLSVLAAATAALVVEAMEFATAEVEVALSVFAAAIAVPVVVALRFATSDVEVASLLADAVFFPAANC